jgi:hypothetical protein
MRQARSELFGTADLEHENWLEPLACPAFSAGEREGIMPQGRNSLDHNFPHITNGFKVFMIQKEYLRSKS